MDFTSHPRQTTVLLQHPHTIASALIGSDPTNSTTLPFPFPPSTTATPSSSTSTPVPMASASALPDADDAMSDRPPASTPAPPSTRGGRGRGRGRGSARGRGRAAKQAQLKAASGRGRRQKMYESARCQAAHERMQELKSSFAGTAKVVKPVVQEIADQSVNELLSNPDLYKQVPEYDEVQSFLKARLAETKNTIDMERQVETSMLHHLYAGQQEITEGEYHRRLAEHCDDRYDQLMLQLDILEQLYDNKLPVDLPAPPADGEYLFKQISQQQADQQGPYVKIKNGVEIPFPGKKLSKLLTKEFRLPDETLSKRKAEDEPEGQPEAKLAAMAEGGESVPSMPRHVSGLLSAVDAMDSRSPTPGVSSNASTPPPEPVDASEAPTSVMPAARHAQEISLPRFAIGPDEHGVRIVQRKATRLDIPNNRIVVPNTFEWDELDIGFRDSTNSLQKGATKAKRGRYLGQPNSNFMFLDRRVGTWDSTQSQGQFDEALIRKYGLHPTMGLVLPTSNNEQEPSQPHVSGWKPAALVSPSGQIIHASRTIPAARQDRRVRKMYRRLQMKRVLRDFCEEKGISTTDVTPTTEEREEHRRTVLSAQGLDPDKITASRITPAPSPILDTEPAAPEDTAGFDNLVGAALAAVSSLEAEQQAARAASAKPTSRPYDAIRDVFTDTESAPSTPTPLPSRPVDTTDAQKLLCLAELCEKAVNPPDVPGTYSENMHEAVDRHVPYQPGMAVDMPTPLAYPPVEHPIQSEPAAASDFLRTALNPPSMSYQPSMPGPEYRGTPMAASAVQGAGRTPFASSAPVKVLPSLRPIRSILNSESAPSPDPHGSPVPQHPLMIPSNTGAYFPPAPHRHFHHGYSHEPMGMHGLQHPMPQPLMSQGPLQAPSLIPAQHMDHRGAYSLSPPPYYGSHPTGAAGPPQLQPLAPGMPQLGPAQISPVSASPRSRPGSSSSAPNTGNSAAAGSAKYRKLEPAPTPPHRMGHGGNGQELRTVPFDYREAIKDYKPVEAPPRHGPTHVRGWSHNNLKKTRSGRGEEE